MEREFLSGFNLEKESIDSIMAEYGKSVNAFKESEKSYQDRITTFETEIAGYKSQIEELNNTIISNNKSLESLQALTNENNNLKMDAILNDCGVDKRYSKFVKSEVMSNVNDDVTFEEALKTYKKDNPHFFGGAVKTQSSATLSNGLQPRTSNDIMNNILRKK